jgi:aminoglycoside phosphotransferase family enzyme/predicted kinase
LAASGGGIGTPPLARALRTHLQSLTGAPVDLIETHISCVLLAGERAYKLKKPVRLPFLDFSTPALRRHWCEEELRLNKRLAPDLYLGVEPVTGRIDAPRIGGSGAPIDHVVCMRRFAAGALLSERLAAGRLESDDLDRLAARIATFHRDAAVADTASRWGTPREVLQPVFDVLQRLAAATGSPVPDALRRWAEAQDAALHAVWAARRAQGAVRECHGDLHLANAVRLDGEVTAFDCIEFDPALRWTDTMSDVGFLTMDLKAHSRTDLAYRFLDTCLQHAGDFDGLAVLRFYEVYRALVRALVGAIRVREGAAPQSPDYLQFALQLAQERTAPRLLITHGLSGSGKSTIAAALLQATGAVRMRSDVERKRLFGLAALERSDGRALDIYTPEATRRTFDRLAELARAALRAGWPVIVDAAFLRRGERQRFAALAAECDVPFAILHCHADASVLRERVSRRFAESADASEAGLAVLESQLQWNEPLDLDERARAIEVDTPHPVDIAALAARWAGS